MGRLLPWRDRLFFRSTPSLTFSLPTTEHRVKPFWEAFPKGCSYFIHHACTCTPFLLPRLLALQGSASATRPIRRTQSKLGYTTQVNSAFCTLCLANLEVISKVLFTSEQLKRSKMASYVTLITKSNVFIY